MNKAKQTLPTPEQIQCAIDSAGCMDGETYKRYGYDNIMPYSKALDKYNDNHKQSGKKVKKSVVVDTFWKQFSKVKSAEDFRQILGSDILLSKEGIHLIKNIKTSKLDKSVLIATFDVSDSEGNFIKEVGYPLDSLHKHLKPKK